MDQIIEQDERLDEIGFGNLRLIQKPEDFCYGIDAVILADFAATKKNKRIADLGTGTGIIPMILSHKTKAAEIFGFEVQKNSYDRACRNIRLNNLGDRIKLINCDVKNLFEFKDIEPFSFDAVVTNPPYVKANGGIKNENSAKTIARHETTAKLFDFIVVSSKLLKDKGDFFMVHRPDRLVDIIAYCRENKLEPKRIQFVSPRFDKKPNILLIHCVKNGGKELKFLKPLFVYNENGEYTEDIKKIYEKL